MRYLTLLLGVLLVILSACGGGQPTTTADSSLQGLIQADGSSTVYPITEAMAEEFQKRYPGVRITVGISGTGGGFKRFCAGEIDMNGASRPIKAVEQAACRANGVDYIELPVAFDGIAVVVHPDNTWVDYLTVEELRRIWAPEAQGQVTRWRHVRPEWPDKPLNLFGPGVDSGTYDYFTVAVVGQEGQSRGDFQASEDDNVLVQGVASDPYALGFFGYAYYEQNRDRLHAVPIDDGNPANGEGPITPSPETIKEGTYQPLSRPIFIYVNAAAAERPEVAAFIRFYLDPENAAVLVREVGYVPLPDRVYTLAFRRFEERITGSVFGGGAQVGVSLEELLRREGE